MIPSAALVLPVFLAFFIADLAVETALLLLNLRRARQSRGVPAPLRGRVEDDVAERSRSYTLAKGRFALVSLALSAAATLVALFSGLLPWLDRALRGAGLTGAHLFVVYLCALALAGGVLGLPLSVYGTFVLEARYGFNRTRPAQWLKDRLLGLAVALALGVPLLYAAYGFMRFTGALWWLWLWAFLAGWQVLMQWLVPTFIAPLFNRFDPLPEGALRARLEGSSGRASSSSTRSSRR
jgi:STE24 endopeptidase